jgi:CheY-specific phosphatase CheX
MADTNTTLKTLTEVVKSSVENVFATIQGSPPECKTIEQKLTGSCTGIVGVISFEGEPAWSLGLVLPAGTAPALAQQFCGMEIPFDSADMGDIVGELANVLAGEVVAQSEKRRLKSKMTLPTNARGSDLEILANEVEPLSRLHFDSPQGEYWCTIALSKDGKVIGRKSGV